MSHDWSSAWKGVNKERKAGSGLALVGQFDSWRHGLALPRIKGNCPRCGGELHHYIDYKRARYVAMCVQQKNDGKRCGCWEDARIHITNKPKK